MVQPHPYNAADMAEATAQARSWLDKEGYTSGPKWGAGAGGNVAEQAGDAHGSAAAGPMFGPDLPFHTEGDDPTAETGAIWATPGNPQPRVAPPARGTVPGPAATANIDGPRGTRVRQRPHEPASTQQSKRRCKQDAYNAGAAKDECNTDKEGEEGGSGSNLSNVEVSSGKRAHGCSIQ